mgnify:CR=1 FL=1
MEALGERTVELAGPDAARPQPEGGVEAGGLQASPIAQVTIASLGHDGGLVLRTEFRAQSSHVHVNRARTAVVIKAPHLLQKLLTTEHSARVLHQKLQELEQGDDKISKTQLDDILEEYKEFALKKTRVIETIKTLNKQLLDQLLATRRQSHRDGRL